MKYVVLVVGDGCSFLFLHSDPDHPSGGHSAKTIMDTYNNYL